MPLIHYHKFIAKLKRNGINVKTSTSSVSFFLRREIAKSRSPGPHVQVRTTRGSGRQPSALRRVDQVEPKVNEVVCPPSRGRNSWS